MSTDRHWLKPLFLLTIAILHIILIPIAVNVISGTLATMNSYSNLTPSPSPASDILPDLTVTIYSGGYVPVDCVKDYSELERLPPSLCVQNLGKGDAGSFQVTSGEWSMHFEGLAAGDQIYVRGEEASNASAGILKVDPENEISETNENNNTGGTISLTPPPYCPTDLPLPPSDDPPPTIETDDPTPNPA